jgi:hypothetical protein
MTTRTKNGRKARAQKPEMFFRSAGIQIPSEPSLRAKTINEEGRSVEAAIATEQAVEMWDWERWEVVPEILRADGMEVPKNGQVPLLDAHSRYSASSVLGSVRDFEERRGENSGRLHFSSVAEEEWTKTREGHLDSVSVGYRVLKRTFVEAGKTKKVGGRDYTGPVNVVTKWRLQEVSLVPIPADDQAKLRGLPFSEDPNSPLSDPARTPDPSERILDMPPELRALLEKRGMSADLTDEQAMTWLNENREKVISIEPEAKPADPAPQRGADPAPVATQDQIRQWIVEATQSVVKEGEQKREAFRAEVDSLCELADMPAEFARGLYAAENIAAVRKAIVDEKAKRATEVAPTFQVRFGAAQKDKHIGCLRSALMVRAASAIGLDAEKTETFAPSKERAAGWEQFRHARMLDIAIECLRADGIDIRGLSNEDIATVALGFGHQLAGFRGDAAYHVTGSFPKLTQDAMNKSMMTGHKEFPSTWRGPFKQGPSVPDFKTIHRMQVGAVPNIPQWNDNDDPKPLSFADGEESYGVECYSAALSFSYKLLVNDDMSVITSMPFKLGVAMARTLNAHVWSRLTANPDMRDAKALFLETPAGLRFRKNLTTGAGAPSVTTIQSLTNLMMQMRGENTPDGAESEDILGLMPRYIIGPSALRTTILQVVNSIADPASSNSGVYNPVKNNLIPVIEPLLDASSTTAWYLAAEPTQVETIEVTFLQGQESPRTREILDQKKLAREYIILQTFAAAPLDHRGLQKHAGG